MIMQSQWQKMENASGFPFYTKEGTTIKQWEHPKFLEIRQRIDECNIIRYATYRVAAKLRVLQHALQTNGLALGLCAGVFTKHGLGATEASLLLESCELEAVLSDIYFAGHKHGLSIDNVDEAADVMLNFMHNVYDRDREGKLQVISAKICMAVLSDSSLSDLYSYFYALSADHNNCVTRRKLHTLLCQLSAIAEFLQEGGMFGQPLVSASVETCFSNSPGIVGVSEDVFMNWLQDSPALLSWLTTFNRLRIVETVTHDAKCAACKISPIVGLRYRCVKCVRYNQCQTCYFTARVSHNHKLKHPMQEHCTEEISCEVTQAFLKKLRNLLRCARDNSRKINRKKSTSNLISISEDDNCSATLPDTNTPIKSAQEHLTTVIKKLEQQNKQLHQRMSALCEGNPDRDMWRCLEEHRTQVAVQIQKLKLLQEFLQSQKISVRSHIDIESTPNIPVSNCKRDRYRNSSGLDLFSPIIMQQESSMNQSTLGAMPLGLSYESVPTRSVQDLSTWLGGRPGSESNSILQSSSVVSSTSRGRDVQQGSNDLDAVLEKLQEILANNFTFEDSEGSDNNQLQYAVTEMEDMLTTLIDGVERSRSKSVENCVS